MRREKWIVRLASGAVFGVWEEQLFPHGDGGWMVIGIGGPVRFIGEMQQWLYEYHGIAIDKWVINKSNGKAMYSMVIDKTLNKSEMNWHERVRGFRRLMR